MLARASAALLGAILFAGTASAQETTIKFTLGWKTQGSDAAFFYAKDNGSGKTQWCVRFATGASTSSRGW